MNEQKRIIGLVIWGVAIACTLVFVFQNLQPLVVIYFLGKFTIPIPLSLGVLAAFLIGGIGTFMINLVSFWLSDRDEFEEDIEPEEAPKPQPQQPKQKSNSSYKSEPVDAKYNSDEYDDDDDDIIDIKYLDR
jgi:uncharacterized integral membrane protein